MTRAPRCVSTALAAMLLLGAGATACIPLPIPHTVTVTPAVTGTLHREDGTPVGGTGVAVTADEKDTWCSGRAARATTDDAGRFSMMPVKVRKQIFWFTLIESFGSTRYRFCSGTREASVDTTRSAAWTYISGWLRGDTLSCLAWRWRDASRVTCNGSINQRVIHYGGSWTDGTERGTYRLLMPDEDESEDGYAVRAVVQWLVATPPPTPGAPVSAAVRAQVELPTGKPISRYGMELHDVHGAWRVRVRSIERTSWGNDRWLTFELGPPGQVREVEGALGRAQPVASPAPRHAHSVRLP